MNPGMRKLFLTTHITLSVGWIGGVMAYLVLVFVAMTSQDTESLRSAWISMGQIGSYLLVPLAVTSLISGLVMAFGTPWGLFKHYWVLISLVLTVFATIILLKHMQTVTFFARLAEGRGRGDVAALRGALGGELLHAGVGLVVLLMIEALNVYKPQGVTAYGRRAKSAVATGSPSGNQFGRRPLRGAGAPMPRWVLAVGIHVIGLAVLLAIRHVAGGGLRQH